MDIKSNQDISYRGTRFTCKNCWKPLPIKNVDDDYPFCDSICADDWFQIELEHWPGPEWEAIKLKEKIKQEKAIKREK